MSSPAVLTGHVTYGVAAKGVRICHGLAGLDFFAMVVYTCQDNRSCCKTDTGKDKACAAVPVCSVWALLNAEVLGMGEM